MPCEDYPCCGHTSGDPCPKRDAKGRIIMTCCECGARLPRGARSSICEGCQRRMLNSEDMPDYESY